SSTEVHLSWTAPIDDGGSAITGYGIYRDGLAIAVLGNVTFYQDTTVVSATTYRYSVAAINSVGEGTRSNELQATTP
ncbi:MAG TPA: fibronectin type III domain-containing protein, partial [Candidatus Limnocylindria bacterium]|nr:fibronectin type III domain-containing protein [Candidatus Limnocylindria bacterium]